jgi:hypothetical protein
MTKSSNNSKALQLASRFALPPNSLGYCGKDSAPEKFKRCVISGDCIGVEEEIEKFPVFYPYLKTIAEITDKPIFSYEVIESYWLGNDCLNQAKPEDYSLLLDKFLKQGVPNFFVEELRSEQPKEFIPMHLFQVLHVGVGRATGAVPFNLNSSNQCMIRWGKVTHIKNNTATIDLNSLNKENKKYKLTIKSESHQFIPEFVPNLKIGDILAVHWKQVIKKLTTKEEKKLTFWTKKVIESVNQSNQ